MQGIRGGQKEDQPAITRPRYSIVAERAVRILTCRHHGRLFCYNDWIAASCASRWHDSSASANRSWCPYTSINENRWRTAAARAPLVLGRSVCCLPRAWVALLSAGRASRCAIAPCPGAIEPRSGCSRESADMFLSFMDTLTYHTYFGRTLTLVLPREMAVS